MHFGIKPWLIKRRASALAADLAVSRATLSTRLGVVSPHLCWPQGYFDAAYQRVAQAAGFTHLYTTEPGVVRRDTELARIPRLVVKDKPAAWLAGGWASTAGRCGRRSISA